MNTVKWLVAVGLTFTFYSSVSVAQLGPINGTLKPGYGSALSTQVLGTTANSGVENNIGLPGPSDGSELDAEYGVVSNGVLYLFFAGALNTGASPGTLCTNAACTTFDKLNVFIMTDGGAGGANTLGTNYSHLADSAGITNMGVGVQGEAGLTFDAGFNANYWIGVGVGNTNAQYQVNMYANYEVICAGCAGAYFGSAVPPNTVVDTNDNDHLNFGVQVAINNSATNGVWGDINGCSVVNGCPTNCPQNVQTGVEMAIPLSAIGSPQSSVSICAFISNSGYTEIYNQVLPPITDGSPTDCWYAASMTTDNSGFSSAVNFSALPGKHSVTLTVPPCSDIQASPADATFPSTGGTGTEILTMNGSCPWTASVNSASTNWITITSLTAGTGSGSITYSVGPNASLGARLGDLVIVGALGTNTVNITQDGLPLPFTINGSWVPNFGCPVAVQTIATSYGKNTSTNAILAAGGSELDAAYGLIENNVLYLLLTGNLQDNGNRVHIFFMTAPGGTNTIVGNQVNCSQVTNVDVSGGRSLLSWFGPTNLIAEVGGTNLVNGPGLTFDPGFNPNYWIDGSLSASAITFNYAQLWPGGTNASGICTNGYSLGSNGGTNGYLTGGTNPYFIQATINDTNTFGVDGANKNPANGFSTGCYTNAEGVAGGESTQAVTVVSGIEMAIPLAALGSPTGSIAICAFIANNGSGLQLSNQILGPMWDGTSDYCAYGPGKTTNTWAPFLNLGNLAGTHYFYVGPEMRITGVSRNVSGGTTNFNVTVLPENNTNLLYRLQRTFAPLTTTSTWANVSGYTPGTNTVITLIDPAATNNPSKGILYRVLQAPNCTTAP